MKSNAAKTNYAFIAPFFAFFSLDLYATVAGKWKGLGAVYMILLASFAWCVTSLSVAGLTYNLVSNQELRHFISKLPNMSFDGNGKLVIDKPFPYDIKDRSNVTTVCSFVKEHKNPKLSETEPTLVITPELLLVNGINKPFQLASVSSLAPTIQITPAQLTQTLNEAPSTIALVAFFVGIFPVVVGHLFAQLLYAAIVLLLGSTQQIKIAYSTGMRLAGAAMSPSILISTLLWALIPFWQPALFVSKTGWLSVAVMITLPYLYFATKGAKNAEPPDEHLA